MADKTNMPPPKGSDPNVQESERFSPPGVDPAKANEARAKWLKGLEEMPLTVDLLKQPDPEKWLRQPPRKISGPYVKDAFQLGVQAPKMKCTCWNKHCPFYGNCRKCIVFHMAMRQVPTCQREMLIEMVKDGSLQEELYIDWEECTE